MDHKVNRHPPALPPVESITLTVSVDELRLLQAAVHCCNQSTMEERGFTVAQWCDVNAHLCTIEAEIEQ